MMKGTFDGLGLFDWGLSGSSMKKSGKTFINFGVLNAHGQPESAPKPEL